MSGIPTPVTDWQLAAVATRSYSPQMVSVQPQHVVALAAVVQRIVEGSGDPVGFDAHAWTSDWLQTSLPALGGSRPAEYMGRLEGRTHVATLILRIQSGAYS